MLVAPYVEGNYEFYENQLSNFETVMKDTDNNLITADQSQYNCMSYAFGVFDAWLELDNFRPCIYDEDKVDEVFCLCCEELENKFALRRLSGPAASLAPTERMIAFRIGISDFHFVRRNSDGIWTHKPGANYIREMSEEELLGLEWGKERIYPYISEIAFYAIKA